MEGAEVRVSDFPNPLLHLPSTTMISTAALHCLLADQIIMNNSVGAGAVWPSANRAIYIPVMVETLCVATQMAFEVVTQSGNFDVGIYDAEGKKMVSLGSTLVPAAGIAIANITDTTLPPGNYWLALACSSATASIWRQSIGTVGSLTVAGLQDQDTALPLPDPAVFSAPAASYYPNLVVALKSVM